MVSAGNVNVTHGRCNEAGEISGAMPAKQDSAKTPDERGNLPPGWGANRRGAQGPLIRNPLSLPVWLE